jgi:hypothetical protein
LIRYTLSCQRSHEFESWFKNSDAYDKQAARGLVACPMCGSTKVAKTVMAPQVARKDKGGIARIEASEAPAPEEPKAEEKRPVAIVSEREHELRAKLKELREHLTKNSDYVGPKFPEEARRIHYGETEHRSIYGEASPDEAKGLIEEGIEFHPLPVLPDERN